MNTKFVITFLTIIIIVLIILVIVFAMQDNNNGTIDLSQRMSTDIICQYNAENQNLLSLLNYYISNNNQKPVYISFTNLPEKNIYSSLYSKSKTNINTFSAITDELLTEDQLIQGYTELKHLSNFNSVKMKNSIPKSNITYYKSDTINNVHVYTRKFTRMSDNKDYIFAQISMKGSSDPLDINSYKNLAKVLYSLKSLLGNQSVIITGTFGVHGHEKVFKSFFPENDYYILPMYETPTSNNKNGLYSYDGMVVSKDLYSRIHFKVDMALSDNTNYPLTVEMFFIGVKNIQNVTDEGFNNYIKHIIKTSNRRSYVNNEGNYNHSIMFTEDYNNVLKETDIVNTIKGSKLFGFEEMSNILSSIVAAND